MSSEKNREFIECDICHQPIYKMDGIYDGDDYYDMEDGNICEDCIYAYMKGKRRTLI